MPNTDNLCMSCMKPIGDAKQCPYCGYHADSPQLSPYLPIRSVVANRYLVGKVLEFNGDGVTYAGWDMTERIAVKVREFLPDAICSRENGETQVRVMQGCERAYTDCYQSFLELWRKLMRLMGLSALISVTDVVEDNGTAYAIYEYTDAVPLRKYLLSTSTGYIPWERARQMFMPALSALGTLHSAGIIHRGLSPQTILVTPDGKLKISGFSIWQARTARVDLNPELFPGYAAIEQYGFEGQQGAWTDIYAFAAVLYRALIGTDPIVATTRVTNDRLMIPSKFAEQLPAYVINALINALQILPEDRTRSVEPAQGEAAPAAPKKKKSEAQPLLIAVGITLGIGIIIFAILMATVFRGSFSKKDDTDQSSLNASVTESTSTETIVVPDFKNLSYEAISKNPVWDGKFTFKTKYEYSDTVNEGYVISQSLPEQTTVAIGSEIELVISSGKESVDVPDVFGKSYAEAKQMLTDSGFVCTVAGNYTEGVVVSMSVEPGSKAPKGTRIELTFSTSNENDVTNSNQSSGGGSILDRLLGQ